MTKFLQKIKAAKSLSEKLFIAKDYMPGTELDMEILNVCHCYASIMERRKLISKERLEKNRLAALAEADKNRDPIALANQARLSEIWIVAAATGNSALFRQWADAIDAHKAHKPSNAQALRAAIFAFCNPRNTTDPKKRTFTIDQIFAELREQSLITDKTYLPSLEKQTRRICREIGVTIKDTPGWVKNVKRQKHP